MRILILIITFFIWQLSLKAQNYIDTVFTITTVNDIEYGTSINFAGDSVTLLMDISIPTNAPALDCGKPLALIIHGGAFSVGSKEDANIVRMRQDFAKRGYVTASINYRLGYFQTDVAKNCNVPNWNCINLADSSEWIRSWFRGVQDAKGALRFLINNQTLYDIDPANVFVMGESAGAFIALGVGYLDDENEKPISCYAIADANAPHSSYYAPCIQNASYSTPIANMDLSRPDLGSVNGDLNPTTSPFQIKGVGSFYGATFIDFFTLKQTLTVPALYMFHQPNDLIVPIGYDPLFKGFNTCAANTGCVNIQDRPYAYGSQGINQLVTILSIPNDHKPTLQLEVTTNTSDCLGQVLNPATGGHQFDNFWLRTQNLATFFSTKMDADGCESLTIGEINNQLTIFPNPTNGAVRLSCPESFLGELVSISNSMGQVIETKEITTSTFETDLSNYPKGVYLIRIYCDSGVILKKIIKD